MKKFKFWQVACLMLTLVPTVSFSETERLQANGSGDSQFEAAKSASKQIMAQALKIVLGRAATLDEPARRRFERDIEENFRQTRARFFPNQDVNCSGTAPVNCTVVAAVDMTEVRAAVASYLDATASNRLRVALTADRSNVNGATGDDAMSFIHSALELELGYDVYFVDNYVSVGALRNGCKEYDAQITEYQKKGAGFSSAVRQLEANQATCQELLDRDAVIVVEDIEIDVGAFNAGSNVIQGTIKPRIKFHQTDVSRPLPAPRPLSIEKYGEGNERNFAVSDLQNRLYQDVANYIAQQYNEIVLSRAVRGSAGPDSDTPRAYSIRVTGISRDTAAGREKLQFIERWFAQRYEELEPDVMLSSRDEHVYTMNLWDAPQWFAMTDELRSGLEEQGMTASVDIDRSESLTIAFVSETPLPLAKVKWNDRKIKNVFDVKKSALNRIRQDQATGVAMSLNEAVLTLRNKKRRAYAITIEPEWHNSTGVVEETEYSQLVHVSIDSQSTRSFRFRAPSSASESVRFIVRCANKGCE